jgi:dynein intermediate chain 1
VLLSAGTLLLICFLCDILFCPSLTIARNTSSTIQHSSLLAVGCYDGTVMIFDIRNKLNKPIFYSTVKTGKHTDPVWQVCWQEEDLAKNLNFFSISSDGRVTLWTMSKSELQYTDVMELKLTGIANTGQEEGGEETSLVGLAGGSSFDFHSTSEHLFIVGTEEGKIHKVRGIRCLRVHRLTVS